MGAIKFAACIVLSLLIGGEIVLCEKAYCLGRGFKDSFGLCRCIDGFHGANCEYKYCPFGYSWWTAPEINDVRSTKLVPCSDMGTCDFLSGKCTCRFGYEGRACDRISCPSSITSSKALNTTPQGLYIEISGRVENIYSKKPVAKYAQCSGHGICQSLREVSNHFNGLSLIRPSLNYNNWDADRIQGCVCDPGWEGYDCSQKTCPKGRDPTSPTFKYDKKEVLVLNCQADRGYFSILVLGSYTEPIPYDADPAVLKHALEMLPLVGNVLVSMPRNPDSGLSTVCGESNVVATEIKFVDYDGPRPPIYVSRSNSNTRRWPNGGDPLSLNSGEPILRMSTMHSIVCPICSSCYGSIYLIYSSGVSVGVDITSAGATSNIIKAIEGIEEVQKSNWTNLDISITISNGFDVLCHNSVITTTTIEIFSDYGNIPFLRLLEDTFESASNYQRLNITMFTNEGNGTLFECSNMGSCDHSTGLCLCSQYMLENSTFGYRALQSDGYGSLGTRGDCGYITPKVLSCDIPGLSSCSGHGVCEEGKCTCLEDWYGLACSFHSCPMGKSFFDEPLYNDTAHQMSICSGNGYCDSQTGFCTCRDGFTGAACDIKDCPRDSTTGVPCNGRGTCINLAELFNLFGLSYGDISTQYLRQGTSTWDATNWYECLCSAKTSAQFFGDPLHSTSGPQSLISGYNAGSVPLDGWNGWDCSLRNCPKGHDSRYIPNSAKEQQRVVCSRNSSQFSTSTYFSLSIFKETSPIIHSYYSADQIKAAIEYLAVIGNVSVWFPNQHYDNISTACSFDVNQTAGGFIIQFDTEGGDLPMLTVPAINDGTIKVYEEISGNSTNNECSGTALGLCNRDTGNCVCNQKQWSSDGFDKPGSFGDCSYYSSVFRSDEPLKIFGFNKEEE